MTAPTGLATRRRILHLGAVALALVFIVVPLVAEPQRPTKVFRIVELNPTAAPQEQQKVFRQALRELGYVQGANILIEDRFAAGSENRLREYVVEAVRLKADVIVAISSSAIQAGTNATKTIPIVGLDLESDPVASGFVASLARPGGNLTGVFVDLPELFGWNPLNPAYGPILKDLEAAAQTMGVELQRLEVRVPEDFEGAFKAATRQRAGALVAPGDPLVTNRPRMVADLALKYRRPTMVENKEMAAAGALLSLGPNIVDSYRRSATHVDKILKGAKPGDLPMEQPTKFDLVVNLKTARVLGMTIPQSVLVQATQVIQ